VIKLTTSKEAEMDRVTRREAKRIAMAVRNVDSLPIPRRFKYKVLKNAIKDRYNPPTQREINELLP